MRERTIRIATYTGFRASPRNRQRQAAMLGHIIRGTSASNNSGELAGIKMAPFTMTVIVNRTGFTADRTGVAGCFPAISLVTVTEPAFSSRERGLYLPRIGQVENMSVEGLFVHGGEPPGD